MMKLAQNCGDYDISNCNPNIKANKLKSCHDINQNFSLLLFDIKFMIYLNII